MGKRYSGKCSIGFLRRGKVGMQKKIGLRGRRKRWNRCPGIKRIGSTSSASVLQVGRGKGCLQISLSSYFMSRYLFPKQRRSVNFSTEVKDSRVSGTGSVIERTDTAASSIRRVTTTDLTRRCTYYYSSSLQIRRFALCMSFIQKRRIRRT